MSQNFLIKRLKSFKYAFAGLAGGLRAQPNLLIHFVAAGMAIGLGFFLHISTMEFCTVVICISLVIAFELINTSIEIFCDFVHKEHHEKIKHIKDISAAAVFVASMGSLVIGLIIFLPRLILIYKSW